MTLSPDAVAEKIAGARLVKALALVREIRKATVTATERLTDEEWAALAQVAGVNAPSQTTAKLVVAILEGM